MTLPLTQHQQDLLTTALAALRSGISLVPVSRQDKRPVGSLLPRYCSFPRDPKENVAKGKPTWKPYQTVRPDAAEVERWIRDGAEIAVVGGAVSGGLVVLDVDEPRFYGAWGDEVGDLARDLPAQQTGGGGYQVFFRCPRPGSNDKLAYVADLSKLEGRSIAIETRAEGGYAIVAPSLHPSGNAYVMLHGDLAKIPTLSQAHADALLNAARSLCEAPLSTQQQQQLNNTLYAPTPTRQSANGHGNVIDTFNSAIPIEDILRDAGYQHCYGNRYAPPGAPSGRDSVEVYPATATRPAKAYHWDTNYPLSDGHAHDGFDIWCYFEHRGDVKAAIKEAANRLCMPALPKAAPAQPAPPQAVAAEVPPAPASPPETFDDQAPPVPPAPPQDPTPPKLELWQRWRNVLDKERARLLWSSLQRGAYIQLADSTVLNLYSDECALWFQERTAREASYGSNIWTRAAGALRSWIKEFGEDALVHTRVCTDFDQCVSYIGIAGDTEMYKITSRAIAIVANGTDGILIQGGTAPRIDRPAKTGELAHWLIDRTWADPVSKLTLGLYGVMLAMGTAQTYNARPLLIATGPQGSGKTTSLTLLGQAIVGAGCRAQGIKKDDTNEARIADEQLAIFDNVDNPPRGVDIEDFFATSSTSSELRLRKLYSNAEMMQRPLSAFVAATSFTLPSQLKRSDVLGRSLIIHFAKAGRTQETSQRRINREALWHDLLCLIQQTLKYWRITPTESEIRSIAYMRIAHALVGADVADKLEQQHLSHQRGTIATDDALARCLADMPPDEPMTAGQLLNYWKLVPNADLPDSATRFGKFLANRAGDYGNWQIIGVAGRSNMTFWTFTPRSEAFGLPDDEAIDALTKMCEPEPFIITDQWQDVPPGFQIPGGPGIEITMNMTTGAQQVRRVQP
jgi:hypothetical protein